MGQSICNVPFDLLENFMKDVFILHNVPEADAAVCANHLIMADKRGMDTHGVGRFKPIYLDRINRGVVNPVTKIKIVKESPATAVIDGQNGMGHIISKQAMEIAIHKAKQTGMGMTVVRNSNHFGIAGYYALMATEQDMIGIIGTNARPSVAPTLGVEPMLGTNPLCFGMPSDEDFPFVLDCATSLVQRGKIEAYARLGKPLPQGWVLGEDGRFRTDTDQVLKDFVAGKASLAPLGGPTEEMAGYKGYGYATVVEILSAALQQGAFLKALTGMDSDGNRKPFSLGHFFIAISIEAFTEPKDFKKSTGEILRALRIAKKMPDEDRIYTAGEKEHLTWLERMDVGAPVDGVVQKQLVELRDKWNLNQYKFPFE
ncbi:Ldh family oxidoreductase [candidate division KSB1 bacterium]|nr:Ldh family oxidoreductase [candidate division KSB1 bacterium]